MTPQLDRPVAAPRPNARRALRLTARPDLDVTWSGRAMQVFLFVVVAHWVEHVVQAFQVFVLGWARPDARGVLGLAFPWLVSSEALHYAYAVVMLVGLVYLLPAFEGRARTMWAIALGLQVWHHAEHALLLAQAIARPFFGAAEPTSLIQLLIPRIELHLFYNFVVFVPMVVAVDMQSRARWRRRIRQAAV